jgi:hypothetical protein
MSRAVCCRRFLLSLLIVIGATAHAAAQAPCDRACLTGVAAAARIIKVRDRKIHEIEATGAVLPFNSKNGWSDFLR